MLETLQTMDRIVGERREGTLLDGSCQVAAAITDEGVERAASLLDDIIHSPNPAEAVARNLDQIDALLPALLELNIRQARLDGRPDLAEALEKLQMNIELQLDISNRTENAAIDHLDPRAAALLKRVMFLVPDAEAPSPRARLLGEALHNSGVQVIYSSSSPADLREKPDVMLTFNPQANPRLFDSIVAGAAAKIPLILDLDADFEHMPAQHPDYGQAGLGQKMNARVYTAGLLFANLITVPDETLATSLRNAGYPVRVLPDGWSRSNPLWEKASPPRNTINLGWVGYPGQVSDLVEIRRTIQRLMYEFPQTQLVVIGNSQAYQFFGNLPQNRRLFLPPVDYEDYPYLLGQVDILLAPFQNIPFNYTQSDQLLVQAGVKHIPWIATPMPAIASWKTGGALASTQDEWHSYLRQFILDPSVRAELGRAGYEHAQEREINRLGPRWIETIVQVIQNAQNTRS